MSKRGRYYPGVSSELSDILLASHNRFAGELTTRVRRSVLGTFKRARTASRVFGVAGLAFDAASNVFEGTRRALDLTSVPEEGPVNMGVVHDPNVGAYNQRKRVYHTAGKKLGKVEKKLKMIGAHMQSSVDRFQGIDKDAIWADAAPWPGWWSLGFQNYGDESSAIYPYYLLDLNCAHRNIASKADGTTWPGSNAQALCRSVPFYRMVRTNAGDFKFDPVPGVDGNNTATNCWTIERTPFAAGVGGVRPSFTGFIGDVKFKLMLYGAAKVPSTVDLSIVQFSDSDYCPAAYAESVITGQATEQAKVTSDPFDDGGSDAALQNRWNDFWLGETDKLIGNPVSKKGTRGERPIKVLWKKSYAFEPRLSTEQTTPHQIAVDFNYHYNKVVSYVVNPINGADTTDNADDPDVFSTISQLDTSTVPLGKGRVFLRIRGTCPVDLSVLPAGWKVGDASPSFDMLARRMHTTLTVGG